MAGTNRQERMETLRAFDLSYIKTDETIVLAGMDEAGRGPLAGPVVAACVRMPIESAILWVDDSKKLSEKRRELLYDEIMAEAEAVGVGFAMAEEIDEINILQATMNAMRRAAGQVEADVYLIDAVKNLGLRGREVPIIKGDATSYRIAAASIIAKVTRDRWMREAAAQWPGYGFEQHKGYGTAAHIEAIRRLGPCPIHRRSFIGHFL